MNDFLTPKVAPQTVEFDVQHENGSRLGSLVTWALPRAGDRVRVYPSDSAYIPENMPYEVVRAEFEPDNIVVIVRDLA